MFTLAGERRCCHDHFQQTAMTTWSYPASMLSGSGLLGGGMVMPIPREMVLDVLPWNKYSSDMRQTETRKPRPELERQRRMRFLIALAIVATGTTALGAQSAIITLPDVSQHARLTQRIGLTDITIDYHRPAVAGRKIFGGLQPYGEVWRAGANYNTTIEFTDSVRVEGQPLARGIYGLHMIPGASSWIVIFSKNATSWGSFTYDSTEDARRVTVKAETIPLQEILTYDFDSPRSTSVVLTMRWEHVAVPIHIDVDVSHIVAASLRNQLRGRVQTEWQAWEEAANYLLENRLSAEEALRYATQSIQIEDRFENEITKARALGALGQTAEAKAVQAKALKLGSQAQ